MGVISKETLEKIEAADKYGHFDVMLYWLEKAMIEARENWKRAEHDQEYLPTSQRV